MARSTGIIEQVKRHEEQMRQAANRVATKTGQSFVRRMVTERLRGITGPENLARRTGALARGVDYLVVQGRSEVTLIGFVRSGVPYAKIHEFGGVIRAKPGKALAIPLAAAKTAAGVSRVTSPRQIPNLVLIKRKSRAPLLVQPLGKGGAKGFKLMYVLMKSIKIPPRLGLRKTLADEGKKAVTMIKAEAAKLRKLLA